MPDRATQRDAVAEKQADQIDGEVTTGTEAVPGDRVPGAVPAGPGAAPTVPDAIPTSADDVLHALTVDADTVTREITINAPLEDVWEAVSTDAGRERWLEPDEDRRLVVERRMAPSHISWWWWRDSDDDPARHVDVDVVEVPDGTRVTVTESRPATLPVARLAASLELVCT